jgi:hypothetical protein
LGKTKLYNYSKGKDPKNPPENGDFNTDKNSATATRLSHQNCLLKLLLSKPLANNAKNGN